MTKDEWWQLKEAVRQRGKSTLLSQIVLAKMINERLDRAVKKICYGDRQ